MNSPTTHSDTSSQDPKPQRDEQPLKRVNDGEGDQKQPGQDLNDPQKSRDDSKLSGR